MYCKYFLGQAQAHLCTGSNFFVLKKKHILYINMINFVVQCM